MSQEVIERLGRATQDDLRYLLEILNEIISRYPSAPLTRVSYMMSCEDEYEILLRCYEWVRANAGRVFRVEEVK
jgi:hypothetical protein